MLIKLLVLFIALPLAEIVLLIEIGSRIGTLATLRSSYSPRYWVPPWPTGRG